MNNIIENDILEQGMRFIEAGQEEKHGTISPITYDKYIFVIIVSIIILSIFFFVKKKNMKKRGKIIFISLILLLVTIFILMIVFRDELADYYIMT